MWVCGGVRCLYEGGDDEPDAGEVVRDGFVHHDIAGGGAFAGSHEAQADVAFPLV